jgi:hypothetical protein
MRYSSHVAVGIAGALIAVTGTAIAAGSRPSTASDLTLRVQKLERDNQALKFTVGNLCVFFKHPPSLTGAEVSGLSLWFNRVALGCNTFGFH